MAKLHLVDRVDNLRKLKESHLAHEWESSCCAVAAGTAEKLIGADLYVHEKASQPSFFGGRITGYRTSEDPETNGLVVFRFQASNDHREEKTSRAGWVKALKIVW